MKKPLGQLASSAAVWAGIFVVVGPVLAVTWAARIDRASDAPDVFSTNSSSPSIRFAASNQQAFTDRGRTIPLGEVDWDETQTPALMETERGLGQKFPMRLLRTADPDPKSDCHGWVFTGGRHWVMSFSVDDILADNDYQRVDTPQPGDLIIYRDRPDGTVQHSGIVRSANGADIVVESKWGNLGRYLHAPADQPFGKAWIYYRSPRAGHELNMSSDPSLTE